MSQFIFIEMQDNCSQGHPFNAIKFGRRGLVLDCPICLETSTMAILPSLIE